MAPKTTATAAAQDPQFFSAHDGLEKPELSVDSARVIFSHIVEAKRDQHNVFRSELQPGRASKERIKGYFSTDQKIQNVSQSIIGTKRKSISSFLGSCWKTYCDEMVSSFVFIFGDIISMLDLALQVVMVDSTGVSRSLAQMFNIGTSVGIIGAGLHQLYRAFVGYRDGDKFTFTKGMVSGVILVVVGSLMLIPSIMKKIGPAIGITSGVMNIFVGLTEIIQGIKSGRAGDRVNCIKCVFSGIFFTAIGVLMLLQAVAKGTALGAAVSNPIFLASIFFISTVLILWEVYFKRAIPIWTGKDLASKFNFEGLKKLLEDRKMITVKQNGSSESVGITREEIINHFIGDKSKLPESIQKLFRLEAIAKEAQESVFTDVNRTVKDESLDVTKELMMEVIFNEIISKMQAEMGSVAALEAIELFNIILSEKEAGIDELITKTDEVIDKIKKYNNIQIRWRFSQQTVLLLAAIISVLPFFHFIAVAALLVFLCNEISYVLMYLGNLFPLWLDSDPEYRNAPWQNPMTKQIEESEVLKDIIKQREKENKISKPNEIDPGEALTVPRQPNPELTRPLLQ